MTDQGLQAEAEAAMPTPRHPVGRRVAGLSLLAAALAALLLGCFFVYKVEAGRVHEAQRQREAIRVGVMSQLLRSQLRPVTDTLRLLVDGDGLREFLETGNQEALQRAVRAAQVVSRNHPGYAKVRYLDETGMERVRVDEGGVVVPEAQLQDKSMRDFFTETMAVEEGGIYVSPFDLNVEHDQIEVPYRPMLRIATPVFDQAGNRRGIYMINYLGDQLVRRLEEAVPAYAHRLRLLDAQGYWLKADDPGKQWGFQLPGRGHFTLAASNPGLWSIMGARDSGQFELRGGAPFTWERAHVADLVGTPTGGLRSAAPYFYVATEVGPDEWLAMTEGLRRIMLWVAMGLALLTLLCAWLIRGWRHALLQLRTANYFLEQRVQARTDELARANAELRDREALLEETGALARVGGWEFDPVTGEGAWTAEIARIHGLDVGVKPSREMGLKFFGPDDQKRLQAAIAKSIEDGTPYDLEVQLTSADGQQKWVRTMSRPLVRDGRVVRMRGAMQDITDRKNFELRLQQQLRRLYLLERTTRAIGERQDLPSILQVVTSSLETQLPLDFACVCLYDPPEPEMTVATIGPSGEGLAAQVGMVPQTRIPLGTNGLARCVQGHLVHEPDLTSLPSPLAERFVGAGLHSLVFAPLSIENMVFGVLVAARRAPFSFSSGDCEFLRQLSEHVALAVHQAKLHGALQTAYEDLATTQQAVMQQERLRVLGQMASGIAHDINNAISPIMLYTGSLLENEPGLSDRARNALLTIQQAVSDVAETVARLREFYRHRSGQGELQSVQVNAVVRQLPDLTRARWQAMPQQQGVVIDLQLDLADPLPQVRGVENEIREALVNLVFNAVDAMPQGGRLTLRTRQCAPGKVCAEVIDTGTGMDEETQRRCLEPFFTTKGERGTGLGLAMVYGVMQRHEGEVEIDSTPGTGTTFRLIFNQAENRTERSLPLPVTPLRGLHLLLVDDDPILLRSLRETLELDSHTILAASDGAQGIELLRASLEPGARPVSAVITDLGMPNIDGRAVAAAIKQLAPQVPVVLLTGWGERLLAEGQTIPNVDRVLGKPPRLHELRRVLSELVSEAREAR